jgi:hypothetical protein
MSDRDDARAELGRLLPLLQEAHQHGNGELVDRLTKSAAKALVRMCDRPRLRLVASSD